MTREEVIASLEPGEAAAYAVDALLHMLEMAAWELCNNVTTGKPADRQTVELVGSIDRIVELTRKTHTVELGAICNAALEFVPRGTK